MANDSFLHKLADALDGTRAFLFFTSPLWLAGAGVAAGILLAPVLGVGAVAAAVVGGVAGLASGVSGFMAMAPESSKLRWIVPTNYILYPLEVLEDKVYTRALAQEITPVDKKRLSDAYNKVAAPTREAKKFLASGQLYATVALTVRNGQGTVDSSVKDIEAKKYPLAKALYTP